MTKVRASNGHGGSAEEGRYPMRVVVRLTGLTADTLRAWERRYGVIEPVRTGGNARRYTESQVRRLRLLRTAVSRGHAIGELVSLDDAALTKLGATEVAAQTRDPLEPLRSDYLAALARFDAAGAEQLLARASQVLGARALVLDVLAPLMRSVGERWHDGELSVSEEHLATQQIRALVESLLRVRALAPGAPKIVLAAPPQHLHDLGLVLAALLAAHRGVEPILLGADTPLDEIEQTAARTRAGVVALACARALSPTERKSLPAKVAALAKKRETWVGVPPDHALASLPAPARVFTSLEAFDTALVGRFETR